jgi:phage-related protein
MGLDDEGRGMTVNAGELSYNGYLFGNITGSPTVHVTEVEGLDLPAVRSSDVNLPGAHGALPGQDRLGPRVIDLTTHVVAANQAELVASLLAMSAAVAPRDDELPLILRFSDDLPEMRVYCRLRRRAIPLPQHHAHSNARCVLQLAATDPRIYSEEEYSAAASAPVAGGGLAFPFAFPFNFGNPAAGSTVALTNAGTMDAPWTAVVSGPCTGITITGPSGDQIRWNGVLTASETLTFDAHPSRRTVLLQGTASRYGLIDPLSTWFLLAPGENQVSFNTDSSTGTASFHWRDAWWSVQ